MLDLGRQSQDSGHFPEGDLEALKVLKQRSNIHAFISPFYLFMKHCVSPVE